MRMSMNGFVVGCFGALVALAVACSTGTGATGSPGPAGADGAQGPAGTEGPQGPAGPSGAAGADGEAGAPGAQGSTGATGAMGAPGEAGAPGTEGPQGPAGPSGAAGQNGSNGTNGTNGANGPVGCGSVEIDPGFFGSACGAGTNGLTTGYFAGGSTGDGNPVCLPGTVQCQYSPGVGLLEVCADSSGAWSGVYTPASQSTTFPGNPVVLAAGDTCDEDLNCDGTPDNTTGAGTNVALVRHALTWSCPVQASDGQNPLCDGSNGGQFLKGLCRNAAEHCLATGSVWCETQTNNGQVVVSCDGNGFPETGPVGGNREGVTLSDFGDLSVQSADEAKMGQECLAADGVTVRVWDCAVDANGNASVTCTGPAVVSGSSSPL